MTPFDPALPIPASMPENKGSKAVAPLSAPVNDQNMNYSSPSAGAPPADIAAPAESGEAPPCRERRADEPAVVRYFHGPEGAVFDEAPPMNPETPEPEETVGEQLTARQLAFCERYVECPVAGRAARRAGYAESTAADQAARLLKNPRVMRAILELRRKRQLEQAYRRETLLDKFEAIFTDALERREFYAAIQALTMQARLAGFTEAMPSVRYLRALPNAGEQVIWDAVNRLEQKLCEITVGDFAGAVATGRVVPDDTAKAAPAPEVPLARHRPARRR